jgi:hypothetical protein
MRIRKNLGVLAILSALGLGLSDVSYAQTKPCFNVDRIGKWEILDVNQALVYDKNNVSLAFVTFSYIDFVPYSVHDLRQGSPSFRFFSPTICLYDKVQVFGRKMTAITSIEMVRKQ